MIRSIGFSFMIPIRHHLSYRLMSYNGNREIVFPDSKSLDPIQIRIIQVWVALYRVIHSQLHVFIYAQLVIRKKIDTFKILEFS